MGDAYPELRDQSRDRREDDSGRGESLRRRADRRACRASRPRSPRSLDTPSSVLPGDVAFQLYDTFGVPRDFIEDMAATQRLTVDRAGFERAMEGQRDKARAQSAFGGAKKGASFAVADEAALQRVGDQFDGYTTTSVEDVPVVALFERSPSTCRGPGGRTRWLRRPCAHAVLCRIGRPGLGLRDAHQRLTRHAALSWKDWRAFVPDCRARIACASTAGIAARSRSRDRDGRCRGSRRDATQPHGHAPAPRGAAPRARLARQTGRVARRARPAAVRLRALSGGHAQMSSIASSESSTSRSS